jgi:hypothetical protein
VPNPDLAAAFDAVGGQKILQNNTSNRSMSGVARQGPIVSGES